MHSKNYAFTKWIFIRIILPWFSPPSSKWTPRAKKCDHPPQENVLDGSINRSHRSIVHGRRFVSANRPVNWLARESRVFDFSLWIIEIRNHFHVKNKCLRRQDSFSLMFVIARPNERELRADFQSPDFTSVACSSGSNRWQGVRPGTTSRVAKLDFSIAQKFPCPEQDKRCRSGTGGFFFAIPILTMANVPGVL